VRGDGVHLSSPDSSIAVKHLWPAMMLQRFRKSLISCKLLFKSAHPFCCSFEEAKNKVCLTVESNQHLKQELSPVDSVLHHHTKTKKKPPTIPLLALPTATGQLVEIQQEFRVARSPIANPSSCFDGSFLLQTQTQNQKQKKKNRSCCSYKFVGIRNYLDRFSSDLFESDGMAANSASGLCCLVFFPKVWKRKEVTRTKPCLVHGTSSCFLFVMILMMRCDGVRKK
jgi:hypothetical protein